MKTLPLAVAGLLSLAIFAGCSSNVFKAPAVPDSYAKMGFKGKDTAGKDPNQWPSLRGQTLTIMDQGAFPGFDQAKLDFEALTGATLVVIHKDDAGTLLTTVLAEQGKPTADIAYGIDNAVLAKAVKAHALTDYKPQLAYRIQKDLIFFGENSTWPATPVDHGYVGVNVDTKNPALGGVSITKLTDITAHNDQFVTQNPKTSSPGWGFLIITVQKFGEDPNTYNWKKYWNDLFTQHAKGVCPGANCEHLESALVTPTWTAAYQDHFSGGYGAPVNGGTGAADRAMVTSYTESPAYEYSFGRALDGLPQNILEPQATWHQVQTMAILNGTAHLAAAQAWIEFSLTDAFQSTRASKDAVYPVVASIDVSGTYHDVDPSPGMFYAIEPRPGHPYSKVADYQYLGQNLDRWLREWEQLCEASHSQATC